MSSIDETSTDIDAYITELPKIDIQPQVDNFCKSDKTVNPYGTSLWYNTAGDFGNHAIGEIQKRVIIESKRKRKLQNESNFLPPTRFDSLNNGTKRVDSPIKDEVFLIGADNLKLYTDIGNGNSGTISGTEVKSLSHSKISESRFHKSIRELIESEMKYAKDISLISSIYRTILHSRKYKNILSSDQESIIFSNIDIIGDLSNLLIKDLRKAYNISSENVSFLDKMEEVDVGEVLSTYFVRIRKTYESFFNTHKTQITTLNQCNKLGGPKVKKWLDECAYLSRSQSDCWDFEGLLIKPIQRVPKYLLLINTILESIDDHGVPFEVVDHLYNSKTLVERWLDVLNSQQNALLFPSNLITETGPVPEIQKLVYEQHVLSKREYADSINEFKVKYYKLSELKKKIKQSLEPMLTFVRYQKHLSNSWQNFMEHENDEQLEDHYIKSIYSCYHEKLCIQESKTKLIITEIDQKIIKAIDLVLEKCNAIKVQVKKHSNDRDAYISYIRKDDKSYFPRSFSANAVQEYVTIENQIKDELPVMLDKIQKLFHYITLRYDSLIVEWFKILSGDQQIASYSEALKSKSLTLGDNFDIIELYCISKRETKKAIQDLCSVDDSSSKNGLLLDSLVSNELQINSSKVVRRLFGV
ncbi:hypothetical protein WICMUC_004170 [Wickerhamomyces mucosus]|uniref:DH domain-containing protein n=1 Tax=Wickerhamomyces mucosus TaxID=1378264 RepID=A0A9P8PK41_9ASCO|nr:hypothetical protein WICMUC_004170 [Wickerhamomyces mucosus]